MNNFSYAPLMGETPPQTLGPAQAPIFESRPPQPASRGESQSSIQPSLAILVPASTPPTTPKLPSATSPPARPPTTSSPSPSLSLPPPPQLPTTGHPSTATPILTSSVVFALETPSQIVVRAAEAASPRPSRTTPVRTAEGRDPAPVPTPELPPSPPRTPSPTPTENQLWEEPSEDCCACYEALASPLVYLESCSHRLHLPSYTVLRVRTEADLRCPACRAIATVNEADGMALRQHINEVMVEVLTVAWREMPTRAIKANNKSRKRRQEAASNMQRLPWSGYGDSLRTSVLLVRRTSLLCFRLLRGCSPPS